jgi:hypothetical protein
MEDRQSGKYMGQSGKYMDLPRFLDRQEHLYKFLRFYSLNVETVGFWIAKPYSFVGD